MSCLFIPAGAESAGSESGYLISLTGVALKEKLIPSVPYVRRRTIAAVIGVWPSMADTFTSARVLVFAKFSHHQL